MQLVDRHRRVQRVGRGSPAHPFTVAPAIVERPDPGSRSRRNFAIEGERIAFFERVSVRRRHPILVVGAGCRGGDRALPDTGAVGAREQHVGIGAPGVEITDDGNTAGVRRPDGKACAGLSVPEKMGAQAIIKAGMGTLSKQEDVEIGQRGRPLGCGVDTGRRSVCRRSGRAGHLSWVDRCRFANFTSRACLICCDLSFFLPEHPLRARFRASQDGFCRSTPVACGLRKTTQGPCQRASGARDLWLPGSVSTEEIAAAKLAGKGSRTNVAHKHSREKT